ADRDDRRALSLCARRLIGSCGGSACAPSARRARSGVRTELERRCASLGRARREHHHGLHKGCALHVLVGESGAREWYNNEKTARSGRRRRALSVYGHPPGFGPPYGGGGFGPPPIPAPPRTDALGVVALIGGLLALAGAIANLVSGFCGALCPLCTIGGAIIGVIVAIPAIIGIVCGVLGYSRTTRQPELYTGKGLALAGAITGGIAILMTIVTVVGPWLGLGCLSATAPHRTPTADPFDAIAIDA